jgi:hypothetical protein
MSGVPIPTNLTNPNLIVSDGSTVDATSWVNDWETVVNYINASLASVFQLYANKGDLLCYDGANIQVLSASGVTDGWLLSKNSSSLYGVTWVAPGSLPWTTAGDMLYYNGLGQRLPIGTNGQTLQVVAGEPAWAAPGGLPTGTIVLWSGNIASVPEGWGVCDGVSNASGSGINLQGLFVVGAGNQSPSATGGMGNINPLTLAGDISSGAGVGASYTASVQSSAALKGTTATNIGKSGATAPFVVTPRYMALCYIELLP